MDRYEWSFVTTEEYMIKNKSEEYFNLLADKLIDEGYYADPVVALLIVKSYGFTNNDLLKYMEYYEQSMVKIKSLTDYLVDFMAKKIAEEI